jgi:hypothetical protein
MTAPDKCFLNDMRPYSCLYDPPWQKPDGHVARF